jgi:putative polyketide hydroxylase
MDLGWRLAWVLSGWTPASFLNTYETECREVVADSVARAADPQGYCREVISEMLLDLGGRLQHAWVAPGVSTLDLLGPGLTLFVSADGDGWSAAARRWRQAIPLSVIPVPPLTAQALGLHRSGGAMLVRPDGVSVATWWSSSDEAADLERAYLALVGSGYSPALTPSAPHLSQFPLPANPQEATHHAYAPSV